jgi:hypothetical protein
MTTSRRAAWNQFLLRPFPRLVLLFLFRVFHGSGEDSDDLDFGMGLVLALLALPGAFTSILLFNKYATFLQWLRGGHDFDPLAAALPDEYFFIVLSMAVTGGVAVWKWESIFPDRRDFMNLVPLPLQLRTIFFANLLAILFLAGILALDVNAASAVLYPTVVSASQQTFRFYAEFAVVHAVTVTLASIFAFLLVFSFLGLAMAVFSPASFRRVSSWLRVAVIVALFTLLATASEVPARLATLAPDSLLRFLPSAWFLALCQWLRHRASAGEVQLAHSALIGFPLVAGVAVLSCAVGYRRHFVRIPELCQPPSRHAGWGLGWFGKILDRAVLRTPVRRASVRFIYKTLFRSERHGLIMAGFGGLGLVLASEALLRASEWQPASGDSVLAPDLLSIPLILVFCMVIALRLAFEVPVELRANWTFRFLLDDARHECKPVARLAILLAILPPIVLIGTPIYIYLGGWATALLHLLLTIVWCVVLTELLLVRFRKVPFTCTLPVFRQHAVVGVLAGIFGFFFFAIATSDFEHWALARPPRMLTFLLPVAGVLALIRYLELDAGDADQRLLFEEAAPSVFDGLLRLDE